MTAESHTFTSASVQQTKQIASALATLAEPGMVIALDGDLGAGKTHFTQGFAEALGVSEPVTSPTFAITTEYTDGRLPLFHFDLYRLEGADELEDIGFYDLVEAGGVSCIEWASKFADEIPEDALWITITTAEDDARRIVTRATDAHAKSILRAWSEIAS